MPCGHGCRTSIDPKQTVIGAQPSSKQQTAIVSMLQANVAFSLTHNFGVDAQILAGAQSERQDVGSAISNRQVAAPVLNQLLQLGKDLAGHHSRKWAE